MHMQICRKNEVISWFFFYVHSGIPGHLLGMMKYCQPVESKKIYDVLENTRRLLFTLYIPLYSPKICIQESRDESVSNALNVLFGLWMSMFARWRENRVKTSSVMSSPWSWSIITFATHETSPAESTSRFWILSSCQPQSIVLNALQNYYAPPWCIRRVFWQAPCPTPRLERCNLPSRDSDGSWCIDPTHPAHSFNRKQCDSLPACRSDPSRATDLRICGLVL